MVLPGDEALGSDEVPTVADVASWVSAACVGKRKQTIVCQEKKEVSCSILFTPPQA